jgi:hypothetical protein
VTTPGRAAAIVLLVGLSPPVLSLSFLIFPEAFGFVVACGVVWWTFEEEPRTTQTSFLALALGLLPWCHRKYSLLVLACAAVMLIRNPRFLRQRSSGELAVLAALFIVPQALLHLWTLRTWGTLGGPQMMEGLPFTLSGAPRGMFGLLFDRQYGLVADAPWYFLLPAAWVLAGRRAAVFLIPTFALYVPMASFVVWWGGFSTAARYLVPVLPFCAVALAFALENAVFRRAVAFAACLQLPITAYAWQHPRSLWPTDIANPLLEALGPLGREYESALPALMNNGPLLRAVEVAAVAVAINLLLIASVWFRRATPAGG